MKKYRSSPGSRGFTLIELAIVLGVVGVLAAGLFRLMSTGSAQTKDAATAQQQQALIAAVAGFLSDTNTGGGQAILAAMSPNATLNLPLPGTSTCSSSTNLSVTVNGTAYSTSTLCNYLPPGFYSGTTNPYGQNYTIQILKDGTAAGTAPQTYSYMIATSGNAIPDTDGGRISSLIGADGGFIYTAPVCTTAASSTTACGTMGAWQSVVTTQYGFASSQFGAIASRSFVSPSINSSYIWLARSQVNGDSTFTLNSMSTNQYMNTGANLYLYPSSGATSGNNIYMDTGALIFTGANGNGSIQLGTGYIVGSGNPSGAQLELGNASYSGTLASLTTSCTAISTAGCAPALSVTNGDVLVAGQITATKVFSASDERLKMNIHPIANALDNLMKIDPVSFNFKNGGSASMGVVAQQLETVYPELVHETNGTKYVEYTALIGPLIGAIQELKHQNDDLRAQLHDQELREQDLENLLKSASQKP